jgi:quinol monooxygenase YgiN
MSKKFDYFWRMIVRVVELKFEKENLPLAQKMLEEIAPKVKGMEGCSYLEISSGIKDKGMIFTYSHWSSADALNAYRDSEIFRNFWRDLKKLFADPARAWSLDPLVELG